MMESLSYIHVEQTLAIIKPDAIDNSSEIEERILKEGFTILQVISLLQILINWFLLPITLKLDLYIKKY